ncbi:MAG: pyridoxal phosphate-dependent aminotransferase [Acidobacteria bacterium]|nr:pyridoxal phosphate-dependent aminotransferase [Acidobacteriota bacterium]
MESIILGCALPVSFFMFSRRTGFEDRPNRLSLLLQQKRAAGASLLDLTVSNPTRAGMRYPKGMLAPLAGDASLQYRPDPAGLPEARAAVVAYYAERERRASVDSIFLTASTSEGYCWLFKLLADPGERVLVPRPSYPLFDYLAALEAVGVDRYPLRYDGCWHLDLAALERAVIPATRAVVCVSPNNPTGSFLKEAEWERLCGICNRNSLALIIDEVFSDFPLQPPGERDPANRRVQCAVGRHDCLNFVLNGISKALCLPQIKLGWIVVQGPERVRRQAHQRLELIADTFLSVNTPAQNAVGRWLAASQLLQAQVRKRLGRNLALLRARTDDSPCRVLDVEGGWYAVVQVPQTLSEEEWVLSLLEQDDVLIHPGYFFDFEREAFLVASLLSEPAMFDAAIERLVRRVATGG